MTLYTKDSFGFVSLRVLVLHSLLQDYNYDGKLKLIPPTADRRPPPVSTNPIPDSATHIAVSETAHLLHHLQIYLAFFLRSVFFLKKFSLVLLLGLTVKAWSNFKVILVWKTCECIIIFEIEKKCMFTANSHCFVSTEYWAICIASCNRLNIFTLTLMSCICSFK